MHFTRLFTLLLILALHPHASAQARAAIIPRESPKSHNTVEPPRDIIAPFKRERQWTTIEIVLSVAILLFGTLVFALQTYMMLKLQLEWTPNTILRFNGLTLIITGGILLVTAGYSNQQISPVIGLLGAIAGYLLGSADSPTKPT